MASQMVCQMEESHTISPTENNANVETDAPKSTNEGIPDLSPTENVWGKSLQIFIPCMISGFGMVGAGIVLDEVEKWTVYQKTSQLFVLVPTLQGLKGNLEMTLASRLTTKANLGEMDSNVKKRRLIAGNLALIQCQAILIGFLAALVAELLGWFHSRELTFKSTLLLCSCSTFTASFVSLVLSVFVIIIIILSRYYHVNPDNVAIPVVASVGDVTTLATLSWAAAALYKLRSTSQWIVLFPIVANAILSLKWGFVAWRNEHTRQVLKTGWTPIVSAMIISSIGGLILDVMVTKFNGIAIYQPVINGVGGNLVAIQASRISTSLHRDCNPAELPSGMVSVPISPFYVFWSSSHANTARVLLAMVIPGHLAFAYMISYYRVGNSSLSPLFLLLYLSAALLQVILLLYICHVMIYWMWVKQVNPNNWVIPYLTALGDLLGSALLALSFELFHMSGGSM